MQVLLRQKVQELVDVPMVKQKAVQVPTVQLAEEMFQRVAEPNVEIPVPQVIEEVRWRWDHSQRSAESRCWSQASCLGGATSATRHSAR